MNARIARSVFLLGTLLIVVSHHSPIVSATPRQGFIPGIPTVVKSSVSLVGAIAIPGAPLASTDLLWADEGTKRMYFSDRSNNAIDIIDAQTDSYAGRITGYVGATGANGAGPNGVLVTPDKKLWAGDGNSLVQVADLNQSPPRIIQTISLGGINRADELAYDPEDHIILIGNDREPIPVAAAISADTYKVLGTIPFKEGTGLEQPVWNPQLHKFLINVPTARGAEVAVVDPKTLSVSATYAIGVNCGGTGLAQGPFQRMLVACSTPFIVNAVNGTVINNITQVGSGDEVWYNSGDGQFYVTSTDNTGATVLGVIDAQSATWRQNVPASGARNVAALASNNHIFTVVRAPAAGVADTTLCAQFNIRGTGCVGVFHHQ